MKTVALSLALGALFYTSAAAPQTRHAVLPIGAPATNAALPTKPETVLNAVRLIKTGEAIELSRSMRALRSPIAADERC